MRNKLTEVKFPSSLQNCSVQNPLEMNNFTIFNKHVHILTKANTNILTPLLTDITIQMLISWCVTGAHVFR